MSAASPRRRVARHRAKDYWQVATHLMERARTARCARQRGVWKCHRHLPDSRRHQRQRRRNH
jgi:hypothetical protein